jgi:translation initiation factor 6
MTDEIHKSRFQLLDFFENPNIGVFCKVNDNIGFIRKGLPKKIKTKVAETLEIELVELNISDATIVGSLLSINSKGAVLCDFAEKSVIDLVESVGFKTCIIDDKINAAGNDILVNNQGCLVHPDLKADSIKKIKETMNVPVKKGTIANLPTVGMCAVVTNKGCLCHPKATDEEKMALEKIFNVPVMIGTVNHGSPVIGSGLVANSKGAIIGNQTTGIEMGRIEEALGFLV